MLQFLPNKKYFTFMKLLDFPELRQTYDYDCGAIVLEAILVYYGIEKNEAPLIRMAKTNKKNGTSIKGITKTLTKFGLDYHSRAMTIKEVKEFINKKIPVILLVQAWTNKKNIDWKNSFSEGHYVIAIGYKGKKIIFEDPYSFKRTFLTEEELEERWHGIEERRKNKFHHHGIAVFGKDPIYNSKKIVHMD